MLEIFREIISAVKIYHFVTLILFYLVIRQFGLLRTAVGKIGEMVLVMCFILNLLIYNFKPDKEGLMDQILSITLLFIPLVPLVIFPSVLGSIFRAIDISRGAMNGEIMQQGSAINVATSVADPASILENLGRMIGTYYLIKQDSLFLLFRLKNFNNYIDTKDIITICNNLFIAPLGFLVFFFFIEYVVIVIAKLSGSDQFSSEHILIKNLISVVILIIYSRLLFDGIFDEYFFLGG